MWRGVSPRLVNIAIQFFAEKKLNEVSWDITVEINIYGTVMGSFNHVEDDILTASVP